MLPLLICVAGGFGATARLLVDEVVRRRWRGAYPLGITVVNVTGSALLGLLAGLVLRQQVGGIWPLVLGTGFLGGYTTFSAASADTARLLRRGEWFAGLTNGLGMLVLSVAAAAVGLSVGLQA